MSKIVPSRSTKPAIIVAETPIIKDAILPYLNCCEGSIGEPNRKRKFQFSTICFLFVVSPGNTLPGSVSFCKVGFCPCSFVSFLRPVVSVVEWVVKHKKVPVADRRFHNYSLFIIHCSLFNHPVLRKNRKIHQIDHAVIIQVALNRMYCSLLSGKSKIASLAVVTSHPYIISLSGSGI